MTVRDLIDMFVDPCFQNIIIYDLESDEEVFNGSAEDVPADLSYLEIESIDNITKGTDSITINVCVE